MSTPVPPATSTPPAPTPVTLDAGQLTSLAQAIATQLGLLLVARDPAPMPVGDPLGAPDVQLSPTPVTVVSVVPQFPQPAPAAPAPAAPATGATS